MRQGYPISSQWQPTEVWQIGLVIVCLTHNLFFL
jgi:hypothetical protein